MKTQVKKSILACLLFVFAIALTACNKSREEVNSSTYTVTLKVLHHSNLDGSVLGGTIIYKDKNANDVVLELASGMNEKITFKVNKGYHTNLRINAENVVGMMNIEWEITKDSTGETTQLFKRNFTNNGDHFSENFNATL